MYTALWSMYSIGLYTEHEWHVSPKKEPAFDRSTEMWFGHKAWQERQQREKKWVEWFMYDVSEGFLLKNQSPYITC